MSRRTAALLVVLALGGGCGRHQAAAPPAPPDVTVFAAASLREAFQDLAGRFEAAHPATHVRLSFAGSQELRAQIELGARPDVFASADVAQMSALAARGLVTGARVLAHNEPVLVVPVANPAHLARFADLPAATHVVIGTPEVPIGAYTLEILRRADARLGRDFSARVDAHVVSRELNVRQVLAKVSLGEADAAIVYRTDARAAGAKVTAIAIPPEINVTAEYQVAPVTGAREPELGRAFIQLLLAPAGQARLGAAGFGPANPATAAR